MPAFFLELFSEEIPARMQARAAEDLARLFGEALSALQPSNVETFYGPRRIALAAEIAPGVAESRISERGPRASAPEQALAGFLRKHNATRDMLTQEGEFWVLDRVVPGTSAASLIADAIPAIIRKFPWPKSMRWGGTSKLTWVRPLRRITCLLDGEVVPFDLRDGDDDGHGLVASNQSEGHRFLSPGAFTVTSAAQWRNELRARHVIVDAAERRSLVENGVKKLAAAHQCTIADDPGLLDEVAGLVEWPVPLLGQIDAAYMDLPAEVMQVSMRVNQRYFALRQADGSAAPYFAFAANIEASDGGAAIIAGNERVLRARFSDARHFWDLDRTRTLESRVEALNAITFHAKLGSQGERVKRIVALAGHIAPHVGADIHLAQRAALLAKADLTTGMVGEFPELQGVIGGYYARHDGEDAAVAQALRDHYAPKGPSEPSPAETVTIAVALADKIDTIVGFFGISEKPTGSGDPFALRRAAAGIIRIIRENKVRIKFRGLFEYSIAQNVERRNNDVFSFPHKYASQINEGTPFELILNSWLLNQLDSKNYQIDAPAWVKLENEVLDFLAERLRVQLRTEGARHDVLAAVLAQGIDDDFTRLLARTDALTTLLTTEDGTNLLAAAKRAANILRIEEKKDGPHDGDVITTLFTKPEEKSLAERLDVVAPAVRDAIVHEEFAQAMTELASLRAPLDAFFADVTVNDPDPELRRNRLRLLSRLRATMNLVADFSKIDG
jgi:glycyl-tRNA synthetase beta chain